MYCVLRKRYVYVLDNAETWKWGWESALALLLLISMESWGSMCILFYMKGRGRCRGGGVFFMSMGKEGCTADEAVSCYCAVYSLI